MLFFATSPPYSPTSPSWEALAPKWHPKVLQQAVPLFIRLGGGHDGDLHTSDAVDVIVVDLRPDQLLPKAQAVVAPAIKRIGRHPSEVALARNGDYRV